MTQWLIGIFVHFKSSKDDLINCAGVGIRTLLISQSSFPLPFYCAKTPTSDEVAYLYRFRYNYYTFSLSRRMKHEKR